MNQDKAEDIFPLVQKSFSLCVELYAHVNRFPRAHKPLLGRDLIGLVLKLLTNQFISKRHIKPYPSCPKPAPAFCKQGFLIGHPFP